MLELDKSLKPLQSAYTQSGKTNAITAAVTKTANTEKEEVEKAGNAEKTEEKEEKEDTNDGGGEKEKWA